MKDWTKVTLNQMLSMGIWQRVDQPPFVYHMTPRANLESIKQDGRIHTGHDYICWFFEDLANIPVYLKISNALKGRSYWDYDGNLHTAPPLIPEDTIVLKLIPRYSEPLYWYREVIRIKENETINTATGKPLAGEEYKKACETQERFSKARIAHYQPFKFKKDFEVLELAQILKEYPIEENKEEDEK